MQRAPFALLFLIVLFVSGCTNRGHAPPSSSGDPSKASSIHGLAVDPSDASVLYVATNQGLVRLHNDQPWQALTQEPFNMKGFAMHPGDAHLMYASGQRPDGQATGVLKSTDGGVTWSVLALQGRVDFHAFALSQAHPERLWGYDRGALWRSNDSGVTWQDFAPAGLPGPEALASDAGSPDRLFAGAAGGIYRSDDAGDTWRPIHSDPSTITALASAQKAPDVLVAYSPADGFLRSTDGGGNWTAKPFQFANEDAVSALAIDPEHPLTFYIGSEQGALSKTADGGATWSVVRAAGA